MNDASDLARALTALHETGGSFEPKDIDAKLWFLGLDELIRTARLDAAAYVAPLLAAAFPSSRLFTRLAKLLAYMPPAVDDPGFTKFVDDHNEQVQVATRRGADGVLFAFCGRRGALGFPLTVSQRWFGQLGLHVVYLRDSLGELFVHGLPALGCDRPSSIRALKAIATERLGVDRMLCYGNSMGGYAALLYGLEMEAAAVLAINAITIFPRDRIEPRIGDFPSVAGTKPPDLPALYAAAPVRPRVRLVYAADNTLDTASAMSLAGIEGISIQSVPDLAAHDAHFALMRRGGFKALLEGFAAGWPDEMADPTAPPSAEGSPSATHRLTCGCLSISETGSTAVAIALRGAGVKDAINLHYLGPRALAQHSEAPDRMLLLAKHISARVAAPDQEFRLVTSVRDPIAQILAQAFSAAGQRDDAKLVDIVRDHAALVAWWESSEMASHNAWDVWFDDTYKTTFGFDFREHPFDHKRKSLRYVSARLRLLVLRQEDERATMEAELGWLIERDAVPLPAGDSSASNACGEDYKALLASFVAPASWIERL